MRSTTEIVSYHAGGRGLTAGMMLPRQFHRDSFHLLFEADPGAIAGMQKPTAAEEAMLGRHVAYPYCLGAERGRGRLYVTADPYTSSNFEPDPSMFDFYAPIWLGANPCDVAYTDTLPVRQVLDVDIEPLDELFEQGALNDTPAPDFLSLDTQGSELAILKGAERLIGRSVLGVATEFEFMPVYKGQPLFPELFSFLTERGFVFSGFISLQEIAPYRAPVGVRGRAFPGFGDALFLRSAQSVASLATSETHHFLLLHKLAFIAVHFGHLEYALALLERAAPLKPDDSLRSDLARRSYFGFLQEFLEAAREAPPVFPPVFRRPAETPAGHVPLRTRVVAWSAIPGFSVRKLVAGLAYYLRDLLRPLVRGWQSAPVVRTPLETLLYRQGFASLVPLLRRKRVPPAD